MKYRCSFQGRKLGAIGITQRFQIELDADSPEHALARAYETHDHITGFVAGPLVKGGNGARRWGKSDVGCHADGTFGHDHCRSVLRDTLAASFPSPDHTTQPSTIDTERAYDELAGDMSDDAWEETFALDQINERACDGVHFDFVDGDLLCLDSDDDSED